MAPGFANSGYAVASPVSLQSAIRNPQSEFRNRYALYVLAVMFPPVPVQFVWNHWPAGLSVRS